MHRTTFSVVHLLAATAVPLTLLTGCGTAASEEAERTSSTWQAGHCGRAAITGRGIGPIRIGISADSVALQCTVLSDGVELGDEGEPERSMLFLVGSDTVRAHILRGEVTALAVSSGSLATLEGVSVGTGVRSLAARPSELRAFLANGGLVLVPTSECGLAFEMDYELSEEELLADWSVRDLGLIRNSARVRRIIVSGCELEAQR